MCNIVILFSGGASLYPYLKQNDQNYGKSYKIVGAATDKATAKAITDFQADDIPCIVFDYKEWIKTNADESKYGKLSPEEKKKKRRIKYFEELRNKISFFKPDIVVMSGFMKLMTPNFFVPLFTINVHPADLRITDENGKRKYIGDNAVELAISDGQIETRSTIHEINEETDGGPIICVSDSLKVVPGRSFADHQEEMKMRCDGPAMQEALRIIISGAYKRKNIAL
ncbi:MAG: hypothetical protein RL641_875 [Candidatus Parcubacteria bacterium]|jgi:folate-dependent phosphoribosylglycinamide formyltransferase PurN